MCFTLVLLNNLLNKRMSKYFSGAVCGILWFDASEMDESLGFFSWWTAPGEALLPEDWYSMYLREIVGDTSQDPRRSPERAGPGPGHGLRCVLNDWFLCLQQVSWKLVGGDWNRTGFWFSHILGSSSSQLTNIFQRGGYTTNQLSLRGRFESCDQMVKWGLSQSKNFQSLLRRKLDQPVS